MLNLKKYTLKKYYLLIPIFILLQLGQLTAQVPEVLTAHFDKPFYVSGEDAWYKVYFKNKTSEIQSKVVRVEWLSPDGQILSQQKLKVEDNYAIGDLAIPYDWAEGNYLFRAYTLWGLNFGDKQYYQQVIPIYNLLESPRIAEQSKENPTKIPKALIKNNKLQIELKTNKRSYKKREAIEISIQLKDGDGNRIKGNISVAVADGNYLGDNFHQNNINFLAPSIATYSEKYPAEKGVSLKGRLLDKSGQPLNTRFLSVFFPKKKIFEKTKVSNGELTLSLPHFLGSQPIQFFDMNPFHHPIPTLITSKFGIQTPYQSKPLYRSEIATNYLLLLSKYRQYRETFSVPAPNYGAKPKVEKKTWVYDKSWNMEKYTALSDLASFVAEIIVAGRVEGKGKDKSIRLQYDEKSIFNKLSPWYLVNNWLTEDETTVLKMPFREIEKVDMFNSKKNIASQLDPSMVSRGMLVIHTKDGKTPTTIIEKPNNLIIEGFYTKRTFPSKELIEQKIPDFRPVLYWNPIEKTNDNGEIKIQFYTSDAIGTHHIQVVGINESGEIGEVFTTFNVDF